MEYAKVKVANLPSVRRLPAYLHLLKQLEATGLDFVSGTQISQELKLEPIQVRKDLAITGIVGKPRIGFPVTALITAIETFLGWDNTTDAFLIGSGHLGSALLGYQGFKEHGLNIVAAFDNAEEKFGQTIHDTEVFPLEKLPDLAERMHVRIAIMTVPASEAQSIADFLVDAGIEGIWNFTPVSLRLPANIVVQHEDLACGLAVLSKKLQHTQQELDDTACNE